MKNLLILLSIIASASIFSQEDGGFTPEFKLTDTRWKTNIHCFTDNTIDAYELNEPDKMETFAWGNFISFTNSTFSTDYSAPCGNDCFTSVSGKYKWVASNKIEVYVKDISRSGFCSEESESVNNTFGVYRIEKTSSGLRIYKD